MLDPFSYAQAESLAKQGLKTWRAIQAHVPHVFASSGFPVQVDTIHELPMLADTMQEGRFDQYMRELKGLTEDEIELITDATATFIKFFAATFHGGQVPLPLSTIIAHLALYKKITSYNSAARILEIGPGCGYLSLFLALRSQFQDYAQVESCQSFYLLQNLLNFYLFRENFVDHAHVFTENVTQDYIISTINSSKCPVETTNNYIDYIPHHRVRHFPWWKIGDLAACKFDVITSNANLNEFSEAAFNNYANLIGRCLTDKGVLVVQCLGGGPLPLEKIIRTLEFNDMTVAFLTFGDLDLSPQRQRTFTVPNLLAVRNTHPDAARLKRPLTQAPYVPEAVEWIERMYFAPRPDARLYSRDDLVALSLRKLA